VPLLHVPRHTRSRQFEHTRAFFVSRSAWPGLASHWRRWDSRSGIMITAALRGGRGIAGCPERL